MRHFRKKYQYKQPFVCFPFTLEMSLYGLCIFSRLIFILSGWSAFMQSGHDNTCWQWKDTGMCCVCVIMTVYTHTNKLEDNIPLKTWMGIYNVLMLDMSSVSSPYTEPERWRCSTPRAQRTGSSMLWTGVWTGWDEVPQQRTTGTVRLQGPHQWWGPQIFGLRIWHEAVKHVTTTLNCVSTWFLSLFTVLFWLSSPMFFSPCRQRVFS